VARRRHNAVVSDDPDRARFAQGLGRALRRPWRLNQATLLAIDSLAQRYAEARGLSHQPAGETPPSTWFLETLVPAGSHSFLHGTLGGGAEGVLFYGERSVPLRRGEVKEGWTVALYQLPDAAQLAYGIACLFRPGAVLGGRLLSVGVPRGLTEFPLGRATLDERLLVAVTDSDRPALDRLFTPDFNVWLDELPWRRTGEGVTRFELRNGVLCVYAKPKLRTAAALDAFCQRAARIAARIGEAAG
jgi:hypothetical protein